MEPCGLQRWSVGTPPACSSLALPAPVFVEPPAPLKRQLCLKDEEDREDKSSRAKKDKKDKKDKNGKKDKKDKNDKHDKKAKQGRL